MDQNNQILIYQSFILSRGMRKEWRTEFENSRIWKAFLFAAGNAPLGNAPVQRKCAVSDFGRRLKACKDWEEKYFTGVL